MPTIYASDRYLVRHNFAARDDVTIVAFDPLPPKPVDFQGDFFGEHFFISRGISAIGVMTSRRDWFLGAEMADAIAAIRDATAGKRLIGYGASMGAFAVINYADALDLDYLVAAGPQFSIDPAKVPFDPRYRSEAALLTFENDRLASVAKARRGLLIYDPESIDGAHIELIQETHRFETLKTFFSGHHPLAVLQEAHLLETLMLDVVADRLDLMKMVRALREKRRTSHWTWVNVSKILQARGNLPGAFRAIALSRQQQVDDSFELDLQHGKLLAQTGQTEEACLLMASHVDHPGYGETARYYQYTWSTEAAARATDP